MNETFYKSSLNNQLGVLIWLNLKSIFSSRNWIFYAVLSLIPLLFSIPVNDKLLGASSGIDAFLGIIFTVQLTIFFTFGCLFITLPISSDEMSDHVIDLFITRPIRRELLYFSKWVSLIFSLVCVNFVIIVLYFIYFISVDPSMSVITGLSSNLALLGKVALFIFLESLLYGSLFLIIGFIGSRGFSLGIFVAFFELFISNLLFLNQDKNMPRTNLTVIGEYLFRDFLDKPTEGLPTLEYSVFYILLVSLLLLLAGIFYIRKKEFR